MNHTWRDAILAQHRRELEAWWQEQLVSAIPTSDEFDSASRVNFLTGVRHYDPDATLSDELHVRLSGENARGALSFEIGRVLLKPLEDGLNFLAPSHVSLELSGVLPGSTVLVARPIPTTTRSSDDPVLSSADTSAADTGARRWLQLVSAAESEHDLREWDEAFDALGRLVHVLDSFDLDMGLTWLSLSGTTRSSALTSRGRQYVKRLTGTTSSSIERVVGGTVTELRSAGYVKLKTSPARTSTAFEVYFDNPNDLLELHLELGSTAWLVVRESTRSDQIGREIDKRLTFIRASGREEHLPPG